MNEQEKAKERDEIIGEIERYLRKTGFAKQMETISNAYKDRWEKMMAYGVLTGFLKDGEIQAAMLFCDLVAATKKRIDDMQTTIDSLQRALAERP